MTETDPHAIYFAAKTALQEDNPQQAESLLEASECIHTNPDACYLLGVAKQQCGKLTEAINAWKRVLRMDALHEDALYDLAIAYSESGDTSQASLTFTRLLGFFPDHAKGRFNFGNLLFRLGKTEDAIATYAPLLDLPDPPRGILVNMGRALRRAGRLAEADTCYQQVLRKDPNDHFTHWNRSHVLCLQGKWREGFAAWEHRRQAGVKLPIQPPLPEWIGNAETDLPSRLLLVGEQGHGDTIQCLRYIPPLQERGCTPTLAVHTALRPWFKQLMPDLDIRPFAEADTSDCTAWAPLFSLPHRLNLPEPRQTPLPHAQPTRALKSPKTIGLVWAGNPGHDNDAWRSMPADCLRPLIAQFPNITWHRLQIGSGEHDLLDLEQGGHLQPPGQVTSFVDTAHLVSTMDLVICVDTAVAHVAGTLGVPCWMMLAAEPDWRWLQSGEHTDWYPTTRLFRQTHLGNWSDVVLNIIERLTTLT